jgi:glycosyltransferase involved in cell wall biosynthesis
MKILVISQMYPDETHPHFGVFIQREVESLSPHCEQKVVVPRPWLPWKFSRKGTTGPSREDRGAKTSKIDVTYPLYFPLPGTLFLPIKGFWFFVFMYPVIRRIRKTFDFDVIQAHKVYPEGFCAVLLKRRFKKRVVISVRGADINKLPRNFLLRRMIRFALGRADAILTVSRSLKGRVMALGISGERISVMAKGVDLELFRPREKREARKALKLPEDKVIVLSVGWLIPRKNPFALVKTAVNIPQRDRGKYLFVMIGEGPLRGRLEKAIQKEGVESMFLMAGRVEPSRVPLWMNAADIFVLVSFSEGMPNVLYEAMACGSPVLASNVDGAAEIVEHGRTGLLVSPYDYPGINQHIMTLAANDDLKRRLGQGARAYMEEKQLQWESNATWLMDVYRRALS